MVLFPIIAAAIAFMCAHLGSALDNGAARTPPMGFNSYMSGLSGASSLGAIADFFISSGLQARACPGGRRGVSLGVTWTPPSPHGSVTSFPRMPICFLAGCAILPM